MRWRIAHPGQRGDRHQLSRSADAAGRDQGDRARHPDHQRAVLVAAVGVPDRLRGDVRRRRQADGRRRHAAPASSRSWCSGRWPAPATGWPPASACSPSAGCCSAWAKAAASRPRRGRSPSGFPSHERSTAMGIINAGTAIGGVAAPPLMALVITPRRLARGVLPHRRWSAWPGPSGGGSAYYPPERTRGSPTRSAAARAGDRRRPHGRAAPRWLTLLQVPPDLGPGRAPSS